MIFFFTSYHFLVYRSEVAALMNVSEFCPLGDPNNGIIIYIPVRLGKETFNLDYAHCVKVC